MPVTSSPEEDVIAVLLGHERYAPMAFHFGHHHSAIFMQLEEIGSGGCAPFAAEPYCGGIIKWQEHLQSIVLIISLEIAIFAVIQQIVFLGVVKGVGLWRCLTPRETVTTTATTTVGASRDTLLSNLGITNGEYYIYSNGVKNTVKIQ